MRLCDEEWTLGQAFALSRLSCVRVRLLGRLILSGIEADTPVDADQLARVVSSARLPMDAHQQRGIVAFVQFIFGFAAKHDLSPSAFLEQLLELGLPTDNARMLAQVPLQPLRDRLGPPRNPPLRLLRLSPAGLDLAHGARVLRLVPQQARALHRQAAAALALQ